MKELKREVVVGYEADDGTQFTSKEECEEYEAGFDNGDERMYSVVLKDDSLCEVVVYIVYARNPTQARIRAKHACNSDYFKVVYIEECKFNNNDRVCEVYYG